VNASEPLEGPHAQPIEIQSASQWLQDYRRAARPSERYAISTALLLDAGKLEKNVGHVGVSLTGVPFEKGQRTETRTASRRELAAIAQDNGAVVKSGGSISGIEDQIFGPNFALRLRRKVVQAC
jgi:hypothetical protein